MANAIKLLKEDHQKIRDLFTDLGHANDERRARLLHDIEQELVMHAAVEEEIFYPEFKEVVGDNERYYEAKEQHHVVKLLLRELADMSPTTDECKAKSKVLQKIVEHHIEEEEEQMLSRAEKMMKDLEELGVRIEARKHDMTKFYAEASTRETTKAAKRSS